MVEWVVDNANRAAWGRYSEMCGIDKNTTNKQTKNLISIQSGFPLQKYSTNLIVEHHKFGAYHPEIHSVWVCVARHTTIQTESDIGGEAQSFLDTLGIKQTGCSHETCTLKLYVRALSTVPLRQHPPRQQQTIEREHGWTRALCSCALMSAACIRLCANDICRYRFQSRYFLLVDLMTLWRTSTPTPHPLFQCTNYEHTHTHTYATGAHTYKRYTSALLGLKHFSCWFFCLWKTHFVPIDMAPGFQWIDLQNGIPWK